MMSSESGTIKIEQIRNIQEKIVEKPIISDKKVYIIDNCEEMTREAQNCLLKTLEEPPKYAVIILIATNESKLLATIKSRCIKIPFQPIDDIKLENYMTKNLKINNAKEKVKNCEGSITKAIQLKENEELYIQIDKILENVEKNDLIELLNSSEILYKSKENICDILDYMVVKLFNKRNIKNLNCIKFAEETKKRLISNSNYDMCIDNLLIKSWEEFNEKYNRS